jgi:carboxypeptidase C (cathepsin A)
MVKNPALRVLITGGVFDLATPYFDSIYSIDHLGLPPELRSHIRFSRYLSGHMIYIRQSEHRRLKKEIAQFLRAAAAGGGTEPGSPAAARPAP